jgi:hypothetical protein
MAISFVSADSVAADSITIPTTQKGDTHFIFAFRQSASTLFQVSGLVLLTAQASGTMASYCQTYFHIDTGQDFPINTSGAEHIARCTYRSNVSRILDRGSISAALTLTADRAMTYPVLSTFAQRANFAESWIVRCLLHKFSDVEGTPPSGYTRRILSQPGAVGTIAIYDTASSVSPNVSVPSTTVTETTGTIGGRFTQSIELCETGFSFGGGQAGFTGIQGTTRTLGT